MDASTGRQLLNSEECDRRWRAFQQQQLRSGFLAGVKAFYSSVLGGLTNDPAFYQIPIDDHGFHRGDGVFEAIRVAFHKPYLLSAHLDRLQTSAAALGLVLPVTRDELKGILFDLTRHSGEDSLVLRVYVTRGPGGFGVSPRESLGAQIYAVATRFVPMSDELWGRGVSLCVSPVAVKSGGFARIKSLNYLPNVLMKEDALARGFDFGVGVDEQGFMTEGATENLVFINQQGELCHPRYERILAGCTMGRLFELAAALPNLPQRREVDLSVGDLRVAREIYLVGTTLDLIPVTRFEERQLDVGPWAAPLRQLLKTDQLRG